MSLLKKIATSFIVIVAVSLPFSMIGQTIPTFQEADGLVVIEAESAPSLGEWKADTTITGFIGSNYLLYTGIDRFNQPGFNVLNFKVAIEKTGRYRFQWRSIIAVGDSNTEHNDSWLRFPDASDFYGDKNGARVYPRGVGKTPNPEGSSKDGWLKIYQNFRDGWTWQTRTSDRDPHDIFVEFDSVGIYNLEIAGRSNGHAIDRLVLFHSDLSSVFATSSSRPESEMVQTVSIREIPFESLIILPTLADNTISIDLPSGGVTSKISGQIYNAYGQIFQSFSINNVNGKELELPISQLGQGLYFVRFRIGMVHYRGKFLKL